MGSPSKSFFAITCFLAFTVVQIYAELVLLQYPVDKNSWTQNYTCMSDDEGAALLWSVDRNEDLANKDFKPKRPASGNVRDCAVRNDSTCLAGWDKTTDWEVVKSIQHETNPVFDHRFEDFPESGTLPSNQSRRYQKAGELNAGTGSLWFSVEKTRVNSFGIVLCEKEELHMGQCVVIRSTGSQIYSQVARLGPGVYYGNISGTTYEAATRSTSWFSDPNGDGWETFVLVWHMWSRSIHISRGPGFRTFMIADIPANWHEISALGTYTELTDHRVRFHTYDYYRSHTKDAVISTKRFAHSGRTFCAELLVGVCQEKCKINVTLVDEEGRDIETWDLTDPELNRSNEMLVWRVVKLNTSFDSDLTRYLTLRIETISQREDSRARYDEWGIDNFRICQPGKEVRESTISLALGASAACQKLSYTESSTVKNSVYTSNEAEVLSKVRELLRPRNGPLVGRRGFICNPSGCICDRGFTGSKCEEECKGGFYGFSCLKTCGSCRNSKRCVKSTGFCEEGCQGNAIAPMCKTALIAPTVEDVGLTAARVVLQGDVLDEDEEGMDITIQIQEVGGESWMNFTAKSNYSRISFRYEANITGLKPNTSYTTRAVASLETTKLEPVLTFGPEYNWTTCLDPEKIMLMVIPHETNATVRPRNEEGQTHINIVHPFSLVVTDTLTNKVAFNASGTSFPFNVTGLTTSTDYGVKIVDAINQCTLIDTRLNVSESDCDRDSQAHDCKEKCGSCLDSSNCNVTAGSCPEACKGNQTALLCQIALSIVKKPPADSKRNLAWLAILPVLAVCLIVLFFWYRKRKAALDEQSRERGGDDPPLVPDRSTGFPASEVSIPLQQNGEHDQLTMSHTKNDTNMNKDSYENSS